MTRRFGCVVLTMGKRPAELRRAVDSALAQSGVSVDCVVVGNGWEPTGLPAPVRGVGLAHNLGIPAGRNAGIPHVSGDLLLFLDDDAALASTDVLSRAAAAFDADPGLGILCLRVADPSGRPTPRRQVPRLRASDPERSSDVTTFWEGAVVIRREVLERAGAFPGHFFYAHEGTDMAWRAMDAGYRVHYRGDLVVWHPAVAPTRHPYYHRLSARNRVFLVRRHLPWLLAVPHLALWIPVSLLRAGGGPARAQILRGVWQGLTADAGRRRPIRWATVWRMTLAGRPPII